MVVGWYTLQNRVVFLDRDGVINHKASPHDYIKSVDEFHLLPGVGKAIHLLNQADYKVLIVTNQRGIARGLMTMKTLEEIHCFMRSTLMQFDAYIDGIFVCPHNEGECHCRKPEIGLFIQAEQQFVVDKKHSYMIGDSESDILAGKKYGVATISINGLSFKADHDSINLLDAVQWIMEENQK